MAFFKKCLGTINKCVVCGKQGIFFVANKWFCESCNKNKEKPDKKEEVKKPN